MSVYREDVPQILPLPSRPAPVEGLAERARRQAIERQMAAGEPARGRQQPAPLPTVQGKVSAEEARRQMIERSKG